VVPVGRVNVVVHSRLRHSGDARRLNVRSCYGIDVGGGGLGLVRLVDEYGILRGDLLVQRMWLDDAFAQRRGQ